jgi:hypothetical protein
LAFGKLPTGARCHGRPRQTFLPFLLSNFASRIHDRFKRAFREPSTMKLSRANDGDEPHGEQPGLGGTTASGSSDSGQVEDQGARHASTPEGGGFATLLVWF